MDLLYSPLTPPVACCSSSKHISHAFCPLAHIGTQSPRCVPVGRLPRQANEECFFLPRLPSLLLDYRRRRRRTRCPLRLSRQRSKNNTAHKNSLFKFLGSNSCPRDFPLPPLPPLRAGRQHRSKKLIKACNQMRFSACRGEEGENDLTTSRHVVSSGL